MKQINIIQSSGIKYMLNNIEEVVDDFLVKSNGVVVYRDANFSQEEQLQILKKLGDFIGWSPNSKNSNSPAYIENHERKKQRKTKDTILLNWHMEHTDYKNPIVGATWNMYKMKCDSKLGRTGFVDTTVLYENMPESWKTFLYNCIEIVSKDTQINNEKYEKVIYDIPCLEDHWYSGKPTIRIDLDSPNILNIKFKDNKKVMEKDLLLFKEIKDYIWQEMKNHEKQIFDNFEYDINEKKFFIHEWKQGDFVIVDLFKMAHAVYGGFEAKDREFSGFWAYRDKITDRW